MLKAPSAARKLRNGDGVQRERSWVFTARECRYAGFAKQAVDSQGWRLGCVVTCVTTKGFLQEGLRLSSFDAPYMLYRDTYFLLFALPKGLPCIRDSFAAHCSPNT
jgi:hypothetical protein